MKHIYLLAFLCAFAGSASADVELKMRDSHSGISTISSNGSKARIDNEGMPGYVIVDFSAGTLSMVNPDRQEIMEMSIADSGSASAAGHAVQISLKEKGGGPVVAGYQTRKYEYSANGERCGTVYTSSKLLKNSELRALFDSMLSFQKQSRKMMGGFSGFLKPCDQAGFELADKLGSKGAPMRMLNASGSLVSEVTAVTRDKSVAASHYDLPAGMNRVSVDQMMNQAKQQVQDAMQNMPDMNQLMEQMGANGGEVSEEMMEQMKKMQKMLEQLQQQ
ncbi:MAG: hypothetical protein AAF353_09530 [Pseudomonadota bacterium]